MDNNTELILGPLRFTHTVQKISLQETKAVEVLPTTRTDRTFIVDNADSQHKAQVQFLFTGLREINSGVRSLVALFRTSPIISVFNELLSTAWKRNNSTTLTSDKSDSGEVILTKKPVVYSDYIPVALEELSISTINDFPESVIVTLNLARIDLDYLDIGGLLYQGEQPYESSDDPTKAYWLNKWLNQIVNKENIIPLITTSDFTNISIKPYIRTVLGTPILMNDVTGVPAPTDTINLNTGTCRVLSESCRLTNTFAYKKLIGKAYPSAQYMGVSSRVVSLDLVFDTTSPDNEFSKFCKFKEAADEAIRTTSRFDRANGWYIESPISKLFGVSRYKVSDNNTGIFVPLQITINTSEEPNFKTCSIDLAENDIDYLNDQDTLLVQGGLELKYLKHFYFNILLPKESAFRKLIKTSRASVSSILAGILGTEDLISSADMFKVFWPVRTNNTFIIDKSSLDGILNNDTLRATLLNSKIDTNGSLYHKIKDIDLVSGAILTGNAQPDFIKRFRLNLKPFQEGIRGNRLFDSDEANNAYEEILQHVKNDMFVKTEVTNSETIDNVQRQIATLLLKGYVGNSTGISTIFGGEAVSQVIQLIIENDLEFSHNFQEALFDTITKRRKPSIDTPHLFSIDGINQAFLKLSIAYISYIDTHPNFEKAELNPSDLPSEDAEGDLKRTANSQIKRSSVYQDLLLPSYIDLYEDLWKQHAPTFSDLGIINWKTNTELDIGTLNDAQDIPAVGPTDIIEPWAWFSRKKIKNELLAAVKSGADVANTIAPKITLSIPFNTSFLNGLKNQLIENAKTSPNSKSGKTLEEVIRESLNRYKTSNPDDFKEDMQTLRQLGSSLYKEKFLGKFETLLKTYITNNENFAVPSLLTAPGLGGEIYRVAEKYYFLQRSSASASDSDVKSINVDADYRAEGDLTETKYTRHLQENTIKATKSSIDQIPDNKYSAATLFPAIKVYLLDKRGNDVLVDDLFFSINGIVSVDITQDKDDADLAVIKIADPMYILQESKFPSSNIVNGTNFNISSDKEEIKTFVTNNQNIDNTLTKYKVVQGRPIQIRMGYTSMVDNLPIVFTGRITEISPGDVLTIVAQSWKSELIGRQVNFYNTDPVNYGAKDLAVMAIQQADPEGFGDYFPQKTADQLLEIINNLGDPESFIHSLESQQDTTNTRGYNDISTKIINFLLRSAGIRSIAQEDIGLDTRLKNIWYPDTSSYNNFLGIRSAFSMLPSFSNDGWIVPLQPAWDVLKEASRHAWNCIVQVIPYDGQATIFFGHPDQPYFFTKGDRSSNRRWKALTTKLAKNENDKLKKLATKFYSSMFYRNTENRIETLDEIIRLTNYWLLNYSRVSSFPGSKQTDIVLLELFGNGLNSGNVLISQIINGFKTDYTSIKYLISSDSIRTSIFSTNVFKNAYGYIHSRFENETPFILLKIFFNIDKKTILYSWPSIQEDFANLFEPDSEGKVVKLNQIRNSFGGINVNIDDLTEELAQLQKELDFAFRTNANKFPHIVLELTKAIIVRSIGKLNKAGQTYNVYSNFLRYIQNTLLEIQTKPKNFDFEPISKEIKTRIQGYIDSLKSLIDKVPGSSTEGGTLGDRLLDNINDLQLLTYFLNLFIQSDQESIILSDELKKNAFNTLAPNMKVFRVHHWVDDKSDIIQNNIVASTAEMCNTVIIEHPSKGGGKDIIDSSADIINKGSFYSSVKWEYYPKQEVTGVIGLQFHPGMTLANKKIHVFTELNCHTPELSAKLACTHLADGVRKMYRGNLAIVGRNIKPHDRIILSDNYTSMTGPIEVESVIHHWNAKQGWITNITPQAVCDANPGAAILQTAMLEAAYEKVFSVIDFASTAVTYALLGGVLGGTKLALGEASSFTGGLRNLAGLLGIGKAGIFKRSIESIKDGLSSNLNNVRKTLTTNGFNPIKIIRDAHANFGKLVNAYATNSAVLGMLDQLAHFSFKMNVVSAYVRNAQNVEQLPVILSPLTYNGIPFTAGLEMDDNIYSVYTNDTMYALKDLTIAANKILNDLIGINAIEVR